MRLDQPRIVLTPVRLPWHQRINWWFVDAVLFGIAMWLFVIWCAAKAVE